MKKMAAVIYRAIFLLLFVSTIPTAKAADSKYIAKFIDIPFTSSIYLPISTWGKGGSTEFIYIETVSLLPDEQSKLSLQKEFVYDVSRSAAKFNRVLPYTLPNSDEWLDSSSGQHSVMLTYREETPDIPTFVWLDKTNGKSIVTLQSDKATPMIGTLDIKGNRCQARFPEWSPDESKVAFYLDCESQSEKIFKVAVISRYETKLENAVILGDADLIPADNEHEKLLYWSPDSRSLFVKDTFELFIVDNAKSILKSKKSTAMTPFIYDNPWQWSPDSKFILTIEKKEQDGCQEVQSQKCLAAAEINLISLNDNGGAKQSSLFNVSGTVGEMMDLSASWAPNNKHVLYVFKNKLYCLDTVSKASETILDFQQEVFNPRVSPDGKMVLLQVKGKGFKLLEFKNDAPWLM